MKVPPEFPLTSFGRQVIISASVGMVKDELNSITHQLSKATRLTEVKELIDLLLEVLTTFEEVLEELDLDE